MLEVDLSPIVEAYEREGIGPTELARRLGWYATKPDTKRVRRALGQESPGGRMRKRERVTYERAVELAAAIGVDPVDVGL